MFKFFALSLAILTALLPFYSRFIARVLHLNTYRASVWLPQVAALLFLTSFYLPDIHISPATTTFQQHLVGGGMYCTALYLYAKKLLAWKLYWPVDLIILFAWVSALGVLNKLLEFGLAESHLMQLDMSDAYWDLLANTLGGLVGYVLLTTLRYLRISIAE